MWTGRSLVLLTLTTTTLMTSPALGRVVTAAGAGSAATATVHAVTAIAATSTSTAADPTIAAAGDIACGASDPNYNGGVGTASACRMLATSDLLTTGGYTAVLTLGDNMQSDPSPTGFATVFNSTWGRVKPIIHPEAGNHDYGYQGAQGYFGYFGAAAGDPRLGYYSFDLGTWHVVALNSNCTKISGGCAAGGSEDVWLRADLAAHAGQCILAFDHHPRYSSGHDGDNVSVSDLYSDLYAAGADVLLSGHSHDYERFLPQDNAAHADPAHGITQFVVGTGGSFFTGIGTVHPNSVVRQNSTFGVVSLTLHPTSYDWRFVPEAGKTWTDSGSRGCHNAATPPSDFSIAANPPAVSIAAGQSATTAIGTSVTSGGAQTIALSVTGLPADASAAFAPSTITAGASSTLTVATSASTPSGTYPLMVTGSGDVTSHSAAFDLIVTGAGGGTGGPPALRQAGGATESSAATSLTASFPGPTAAGNLLVLAASEYTGATNHIASVTDSSGRAWMRIGAYSTAGHYSDGELWYRPSAGPVSSVTVRLSSAAVLALRLMEFSGIAGTQPIDAATGASNTGRLAASGTISPAAAGELVVGFVAGHGSTQAMTLTSPGWTALPQLTSAAGTPVGIIAGYTTAIGPTAATGTFATTMYWSAGVAAIRSGA